jgi:chromosome segregation ATPase
MISVEQVRALEERVEKAVAYISALKSENAGLRRDLDGQKAEKNRAVARVAELEAAAENYRRDQISIEEGIVSALKKLDAFEDLVLHAESSANAAPAVHKAAEAKADILPPTAASRSIEDLSIEELEAATAPSLTPSHPVTPSNPVMSSSSQPSLDGAADEEEDSAMEAKDPSASVENELDIF